MENKLNQKLLYIQEKLKAPKGQRNSFGKYNYRSCEDIFEAVKPLLKENDVTLRTTDELVMIGDRYYIKATAILSDGETTIENIAYAREEETKKGMDGSQVTGASSSYARKYALNGLFLIDDVKDSDATNDGSNYQENQEDNEKLKLISKLNTLVATKKVDYEKLLAFYKVDSNSKMTVEQLKEAIKQLEGRKDK